MQKAEGRMEKKTIKQDNSILFTTIKYRKKYEFEIQVTRYFTENHYNNCLPGANV